LNFKIILIIILGFFLLSNLSISQARVVDRYDEETDTTRKENADSLRLARIHTQDSIKAARAYTADSLKLARKYLADSVQMVRKFKTDSVAAVRKYRDSKQYKDSVTRARLAKTNSLKTSRQSHTDSLQHARRHASDSLIAARKSKTDSIRITQKRRTDSLASVKKYKTSKRYADSVSIVKHNRTDSIHHVQEFRRDSVATIRKHSLDSAKTARKHSMDSVKLVRTKQLDSIKIVRKAKTDSLAKIKADKDKLAKAKLKKKEESMKLKLELKMKQKHEAWSNKSMLKKNWSPMRRVAQNSFTHYNYYFNANRKMDEAMQNMQRARKENYDSVIGLYPFDPNKDSTLLAADMDSIVHKVSVGIQIHDPRVKWEGDMYLLLGQAYYYKGSYENAATAFRYIIAMDEAAKKKNAPHQASNTPAKSKDAPSILEDEKKSALGFLKHKSVHNEAILWLARTYTEAHQVENAEMVMSLLESDAKLPDDLKGRLAAEKAFAYLAQKNDQEAVKQLAIVANDNNIEYWLRMRAAFIKGQLLQNMGNHKEAVASFDKVLSYYPKIDMDFYARKYMAFNQLQSNGNAADAMRPLKKVLSDGKYVNYYDQVYYTLGQLAVKANKRDEAITYFTKSVTTPRAMKKQKALSFAALGDVYYSTSRYAYAKRAYDSSAKYATSSKDAGLATAAQRNKGLAEITGPTTVIHDQDSLLALSALSKREQTAVVRRYLNSLEKQKEDSIRNAENGTVGAVPVPPEAEESKEASGWYFGNPTLMAQGSADFKRKWGNRPLTDNWRRAAAASSFAGGSSSSPSGTESTEDETTAATENGALTEAGLLAKIPNTPQQKETARKVQQRAYMLLAKAYEFQLEDHNQAIHTLDTLDKRYPSHNLKEEELYLRYKIAVKQNKLDKAQQYSQELLDKFPNSQYASMLRPSQGEGRADAVALKAEADYFDETYKLLMQHQYTEALMRVNVARKQYTDPVYARRFDIAEAMAFAGSSQYDKADSAIAKFMHSNPSDTLTAWAGTVKDFIKDMRTGGKPSWYKEGPAGADIAKNNKPAAPEIKTPPPPPAPKPDIPAMYSYRADSEHYAAIVLPGLDSRTAGLKKAIKTFDSANYAAANLTVLFDLYDIDQAVVIVKKFENAAQATTYMNALKASPVFQAYKENELQPFIISSQNYKKMFADKVTQPYMGFYKTNYKQ
jgi:tetratricopeptide (TPR) repeat protein